jgi:SAM-dependent methyltransferase
VKRALSFGRGAADYDRVRPEYSAEALDLVSARLGLGSDSEMLNLGAARQADLFACRAVRTRDGSRAGPRHVRSPRPSNRLLLGREGEEIPLADEAVDAVFAGQAFHWFANEQAAREMARVLRPRGGLVLIWNFW